MADLGDIPVRLQKLKTAVWPTPYFEPAKSVWHRPALSEPEVHSVNGMQYSFGAGARQLSGTVAGNQTDFTQVVVRAYRRSTGKMAGEVHPAANGAFSIQVDGDLQQFYIIALDPVGGEEFNALIFDRITPA